MNKLIKIYILILISSILFLTSCTKNNIQRDPILINLYASEVELSTDELIKLADLIVIGQFINVHPSRWSTSDGKLPENVNVDMISKNGWSIFTDYEFKINQYLKGESLSSSISVRTFHGEVGIDKMTASDQPIYQIEGEYLLFLFIDNGPTSSVSPGAYYGTSSPYQVANNKVISNKDEWLLEDLIAYIQKVLSEPTQIPTELIPEQTPSATITPEIIILETETLTPTETITPTP